MPILCRQGGMRQSSTPEGPTQLVEADAAVQKWGSANGIKWRESTLEFGSEWASRLEICLTDPRAEPDPDHRLTFLRQLFE